MSGLVELLAGLEDPAPLRRALARAREEVAGVTRLIAIHRMKFRTHAGLDPALESRLAKAHDAVVDAEADCARASERWAALERAVAEEEARRGMPAPPLDDAAVAELDLIATVAGSLSSAYAPIALRARDPAPRPRGSALPDAAVAERAALVGASIAAIALGVPGHFLLHAALATRHETKSRPTKKRSATPQDGGEAAMALLRVGIPEGSPSGNDLRAALAHLDLHPRNEQAWTGLLDAAQERVDVLHRDYLRARAAALHKG